MMYPLSLGTIGKIEGDEKIKEHPSVVNYIQYYNVGDSIEPKNIGTLSQHFCRITFIVDIENEVASIIDCSTIQVLQASQYSPSVKPSSVQVAL